ncbi:MAG: sigma-54-dependent Fis family transcriptional regulator [Candidatus Aminicenantes bacterium]|nr:sigma-54-dependent Fis family transcriptional regulator [Candidatus Aminicenantes bacterium]
MARILFVDDDISMRSGVKISLNSYDIVVAGNKKEAAELLGNGEFDLLLTDLCMPEKSDGLDLIKNAREMCEDLYIVVVTGFATIETTVDAMKFGADDYITKDFSPEDLRLKVGKFLLERDSKKKIKMLEAENILLRRNNLMSEPLLGNSGVHKEVKKIISKAGSDNDSTVIITGSSGTGKELAARDIHLNSLRKEGPFITIDCPTIPGDLFESELFGYEKGAFTDAKQSKLGRIELADNGTLFFDEIGDLPPNLQAKLLRFLETSEFYKIGGTKPVKVNARILSSTNRDLKEMVKKGLFREDLYYRLRVLIVKMPDLKERGEDILLLAEYFLKNLNKRKGNGSKLTLGQKKVLLSYNWPGNVRELKNVMESFSVFGEFPFEEGVETGIEKSFKDAKRDAVDVFEKKYIKNALKRNKNNITKTAAEIGIAREELSRKIKRLELLL